MSTVENVQQYLKLLESQLTPEHIKIELRQTIIQMAQIIDVLNKDPLTQDKQNTNAVTEHSDPTDDNTEGEATKEYVNQDVPIE